MKLYQLKEFMNIKLQSLNSMKSALSAVERNDPISEVLLRSAITDLEADIAKPTEPHGWMASGTDLVYFGEHAEADAKQEAKHCSGTSQAYPIYTNPQEPAAAIPEGWKLVPIEPDMRMCVAGKDAELFSPSRRSALVVYRAMLAAAPGGAA